MDNIVQNNEPVSLQVAPPPTSVYQDSPTTLSISDPAVNEDPNIPAISITEEAVTPLLTNAGIKQKANTLHYALQQDSPGIDALERSVQANKESEIRSRMAFQEKFRQQEIATQLIKGLVKSRGDEPLTKDDEGMIHQLVKDAGNVDPGTIVEKVWGNNYVKELMYSPSKLVAAGLAAAPVTTHVAAGTASKAVTTQQVALSVKQEFDKKWEQTPLIGFYDQTGPDKVTAWARSWLIPYGDKLQQYDAIPGVKEATRSILPGENLQEQKAYIYLIGQSDPAKAKALLQAAATKMWEFSPQAAMSFLEAMVEYPGDSAIFDNMMGVTEIATAIPGGWLARSARARYDAYRKIASGAPIKVSPEYVEANKGTLFTPDQVAELKRNTKLMLADKTATNPRGMTVYELEKAAGAFPESGSYPPSRDFYAASRTSVGPSRGIQENAPTQYVAHGGTLNVTDKTKFIDQKEVDKIPKGSRIFINQEGKYAVSTQVDGKWKPTGHVLETSDTPEVGKFALDLGPETNKAGTKFYDQHTATNVTAVPTKAGTITEPYQMDVRDISRIQEGLPGQMLGRQFDMGAFKEASIQVNVSRKNLDDAKRSRDSVYESGADQTAKNAQDALVKKREDELENAIKKRDSVSVYNTHPVIARAQQGIRSYLSSGVQALRTAPTGNGTESIADLQGTLSTLGRSREAIETGAMRITSEHFNPSPNPSDKINALGKDLPSAFRPNDIDMPNPSASSREGALRWAEEMKQNETLLQRAAGGARVQRLTEEDLQLAKSQTETKVNSKYSHDFHNAVLDGKVIHSSDIHGNYNAQRGVYYLNTKIGKTNAMGFDDEFSARNTLTQLYGIPEKDFTIVQEGNSFYGHVLTPYDESGTIYSTVIPTNNTSPSFWGEQFTPLRKLRSSADQTSVLQMQARYTATHAPQRAITLAEQVANSVKLTRTENKELSAMLNQSSLDFDAAGNKGAWWDMVKLSTEYGARFGKAISDNIKKGYQVYKQLMDFDWTMRANYVYSYWTRWGAENFSFKFKDGVSPVFKGRIVEKFDTTKARDMAILYVDENGIPHQKWTREDYLANKDGFQKEIDAKIKEGGFKIIQIAEPNHHHLKDIKGGSMYYVVARDIERSNLSPGELLPYRGGPHVMYTHPNFYGQMKIIKDNKGQLTYAGDQTLMGGFATEDAARAWAIKDDTARKLMNSGDDQALADFLKDNLPWSVDDYKKMYTGENARDRNMPIAYYSHQRSILDSNPELNKGKYNGGTYDIYENYKDYFTDLSDPSMGLNKAFTQERANVPLMVPKDMGYSAPQRFVLETASTLDPYVALQRGLGQAIRAHNMEDLKLLAAESYVKEFGIYIPNASPEALARNPVHYLYEGNIKTGAPPEIVGRMKAYQENVKNFIGMQSDISKEVNNFEATLLNSLGKVIGENKTAKFMENPWVAESLLPTIKDPAAYVRAVASKVRLGIFNPAQYWQQGQAFIAAVAISPRAGVDGVKIASYLHAGGKWALDDPAKLDYYANMIAKSSRWTKQEAIDALTSYRDSGFAVIGSEHALKKNVFADPKFTKSATKTFLDWGDKPFNLGEGFARDTSYFTAYREWKDANVGRTPNQYDMGSILRRANDMTYNMSRAANSALQSSSWSSIPLQFQTFRFRQMELMLGAVGGKGRLTRAEAARLWGFNAVLYGVPTSTGGAIGYNFYEYIRTKARESGYNWGDNKMAMALHEGIIAFGIYLATGKQLSVASSLGPGASTLPRDIYSSFMDDEGAKTWAELATGPSGATLTELYQDARPFFRWGISKITGQEYKLMPEDYIRFSNLTTTTDNMRKAWEAHNLHREITKNGMLVGSATTWDGILKLVFGLNNQEYQDAFYKLNSDKKIRGYQEKAMNEIRSLYQKAKESIVAGEIERAADYEKNAKVIAHKNALSDTELAKLWIETGREGLNDRIDSIFYNEPDKFKQQDKINRFMNEGAK